MDLNSLILNSIGIQGLRVTNYKFSNEYQKLNIHAVLDFNESRCKKCSQSFYSLHQWHTKTLRVPPIGITKSCYLHVKYPRGFCYICNKVNSCELNFIHPEFGGLTYSFVEHAGRMMEEMTCAAVGRLLNIDRKLLWRIDQWRMKYLEQYLHLPENLNVSKMSADEVHFKTIRYSKKEHPFSPTHLIQYITTLVCTKESKVIATAMGRDYVALAKCLNVLSEQKLEEIEFFAIDMHPDFFKAVKAKCPNAEIAIDRYHLVESMNKVFNDLRKEEFKKANKNKDEFQKGMLTAKRRFILMERNPVLSIEEENMLGKLKMLNTNINAGMLIVDYFHKVLDQTSLSKFKKSLKTWYDLVDESKIKLFSKFKDKVKKYQKNIESYIKSNLTTALSEGLNNKIKVLKRMGYNYSNEDSFQRKIKQRCGLLNSSYIDTNFMFWHVPNPQV